MSLDNKEVDQLFSEHMVAIESKLAYQEDTVQTLNDVVAKQQQDILQLKQQMSQLVGELRNVLGELEQGSDPVVTNERPPHY